MGPAAVMRSSLLAIGAATFFCACSSNGHNSANDSGAQGSNGDASAGAEHNAPQTSSSGPAAGSGGSSGGSSSNASSSSVGNSDASSGGSSSGGGSSGPNASSGGAVVDSGSGVADAAVPDASAGEAAANCKTDLGFALQMTDPQGSNVSLSANITQLPQMQASRTIELWAWFDGTNNTWVNEHGL
ncbi:MAG: hypothetical protein JO243_13785, partial [Solirubrobacterales bacterium]|nr:hypothetical protein [Solirubrobacterales bacterium]